MSFEEHMSMGDIEVMGKTSRKFALLHARTQANTYVKFVNALQDDLNFALEKLQDNRDKYQNASEDQMTSFIIGVLEGMTIYDASHDTQNGGHVDITVSNGKYRWFGEGKIWRGPDYVHGGYLQLLTRYTVGSPYEPQGGIIIYFFQPDIKGKMDSYKKYLEDYGHNEMRTEYVITNPIMFNSTQKHPSTNLDYSAIHIPVILHFEPKDKKETKSKSTKPSKDKKSKGKSG